MSDVHEWQAITAFPESLSVETLHALERTDSFRERWLEFMGGASDEEVEERRNRNLRRHAIETGIIEKLYDIEWGVTEELVAEGLTLDVAERDGEISEETLATINAQLDGLNLLIAYVRENRPFSTSFIRELHSAITATQRTYEGRDQFGGTVHVPLEKGVWKKTDNHVVLRDGSRLQYTPAIFVQDEVDELVRLYNQHLEDGTHPLALAAWLHHKFIIIHPFADGNGRVARALSLLVLIQKEYAPIVVRRDNREEYIEALDLANGGDLEPLVRFFSRLEEYAILAELEMSPAKAAGSAVQVVTEYAKRLKAKLEFSDNERRERVARLNDALIAQVVALLESNGRDIREQLAEVDNRADAWVKTASPPASEANFWRAEIIRAAREVDFYSNLRDGTWWATLNIKLLDLAMRYGVVLQKVGHGETGIVALTFFSETFAPQSVRSDEESTFTREVLLRLHPSDSVTLLHTDEAESVWPRAEDAINKSLTAAVTNFLERVG